MIESEKCDVRSDISCDSVDVKIINMARIDVAVDVRNQNDGNIEILLMRIE